MNKRNTIDERRDSQLRRGTVLITVAIGCLIACLVRLLYIGRNGLFVLALVFVTGCTFHLVTVQVTPGKPNAASVTSQPATTQPAHKKSFIEMLLQDLAD